MNQLLRGRMMGLLLGISTAALALSTGTVVAHSTDGWGGHMGGDGWMGWGGDWMLVWGLLWMVVLVGLPLALFVAITRRSPATDESTVLELLRERYARGEIDEEEYETRRARLS